MLEIKMKTGNAAFEDDNRNYEAARLLREVADKLENGWDRGVLMDINGNKVGDWRID